MIPAPFPVLGSPKTTEGAARAEPGAPGGRARRTRESVRCDKCCGDCSTGDRHARHCVAQPFARATTLVVNVGTTVGDPEETASQQHPGGDEEPGQRFLGLGHHSELALEHLARSPQQRLDGPNLNTFVVSDLLVRPAGLLAHGEDVAVGASRAGTPPG